MMSFILIISMFLPGSGLHGVFFLLVTVWDKLQKPYFLGVASLIREADSVCLDMCAQMHLLLGPKIQDKFCLII
jgi:hypothetical protein